MFSQFRQAVETFAPVRRPSQDLTDDERQRSRSLDLRQALPLPSGQLAESALENIRKSLTSQRAGPTATSPPPGTSPRRRPNLEERLKATFTIGEASNDPSPSAGSRASTPVPVSKHPLSPGSTPLPASPPLSPRNSIDLRPEPVPVALPSPSISSLTDGDKPTSTAGGGEDRYPEADIPLPSDSPESDISPEGPQVSNESVSPGASDAPPRDDTPSNTADATQDVLESSSPHSVSPSPEAVGSDPATSEGDIESLRERLKLVEQRFADVSTSFKRLQAEKLAADRVLREFTPLESMKDAEALKDFLQNTKSQAEVRHSSFRTGQDERLQELRETHHLESASQIELIDQLRKQLSETEALLKASQNSSSTLEGELASRKAEIGQLQSELEKVKTSVKEEEEKRVKAVSLLKTVRQKLVKAEKDREDAVREAAQLQAREKEEKEKAEVEKRKLREEIQEANVDHERALTGLKMQFDREVSLLRDRQDKEITALRGQFELEAATAKSLHEQELSRRDATIASLENAVQTLRSEKDNFFDQLQMRQAELESVQSQLEVLQNQNTEYQYQFRELDERIGLLNEELAEARRDQDTRARGAFTSAEEVAQMLSATEAKYESRVADLRRTIAALEKERDESEADWSRKFREKSKEMEELRRVVDSSARSREEKDSVLDDLKAETDRLRKEIASYQKQIADLQKVTEKSRETEDLERQRIVELQTQTSVLQKQLEELKGREGQLRLSNKTLREELRKVQSSAALLERQRNPGVGYWGSHPEEGRRSTTSLSDANGSRPSSRASAGPTDDEEVNLEYLRNVVLQFLEHKEMRPQLVRVLSTILRFTPQETRRLVAKV
ncbi:hypothetical protein GLOTRDRAFT_102471 [Gloeophyllum trabeum ATCC 11539]|uniref:GRIP domain-containing protein n=1 Tax=Gloeophyllum trabeum (strain ATCC 11539 / FP-39264 / Madison 617) TaxID=670483 RepID=S7QPX5_GLOTA|nr:uncharacterized protein GLOTRDRAFT_102471 [Gloeophyllum trabeum ATCC 11539]EPQ61437.1 hypothetical protein GLOTRDRAFT_102471 [Gloeophyllum trabeum ATCC 11539]